MVLKQAIPLLKETYKQWSEHQAPRLGASVAFYSLLSFAPLLLLATAVIAFVFGQSSAQGALINEARQFIGDRGADTVQSLLKNAQKPSSGIFASVVAFATLLFGASGVFTELQDALNLMWDVKPNTGNGLIALVRQRIFSFGMVLSIGFLLLVSLVLSAALAFIGHAFGQLLPIPNPVLHLINFAASFVVITVLFGLMFRYVPGTKISWKDVLVGAVGTAFLFSVGKLLLGLYLGKASVGSTYGAAGSLVAVIVWIYYSAQIFFFGAEFTHVYAETYGEESKKKAKSPATKEDPAKPEAPLQPTPDVTTTLPRLAPSASAPITHPIAIASAGAEVAKHFPPQSFSLKALSLPHKPDQPRLLLALGIGFVLGRAFSRKSNNEIRS